MGLGGVLEPLQANPTIIEDNCFIGARSEVVEGVIMKENSVLGMGVYIGQRMNLTSTTRLPVDHMISGALIGAIAAGGVGILNYKKGSASKAEVVAKTTKTAIQGGIVTACAISASNKLVSARYFAAAITVAVGIVGVVATEKLIKNLEESK